jgi:hypothetical protein
LWQLQLPLGYKVFVVAVANVTARRWVCLRQRPSCSTLKQSHGWAAPRHSHQGPQQGFVTLMLLWLLRLLLLP